MPDKKQVRDLIMTNAGKYGLDDQSSSIIIANLGDDIMPICQGMALTPDEMETDDFHTIIFGFDSSPSMEGVIAEVIGSFNDFVVPGLLEVLEMVGSIRVAGFSFSEDVTPLWNDGFHPVQTLPKLTRTEYYAHGYSTALNKAALTAATGGLTQALDLHKKVGSRPEVSIVVFSDGANRVARPSVQEVFEVYNKLDPKIVHTYFIGFSTWENTTVDFVQIAKELGFRTVQNIKSDNPNETNEEKRRRLRHGMDIFSQRLSGTLSKKIVPKATNTGGINVWDDVK